MIDTYPLELLARITGADPRVESPPDERDEKILQDRYAAWCEIEGPRVGDFIRFSDGVLHRFSHDWDEGGMQTSGASEGSYYMGGGWLSYSGGLCPCVPRDQILATASTHWARVWFFHHGYAQAHNGVYAKIRCRVFSSPLRSNHWHAGRLST